jgi:hypothetical protein
VSVRAGNLTSGNTTSCGCWKRAFPRKNKTHGLHGSRTYAIWNAMVQRCHNPNATAYPAYGGRGIRVCPRWRNFAQFLADMGAAPDGCGIDRIDNARGYEPGNCRWADRTQQSRNRGNVLKLSVCGWEMTIPEWAEQSGIPASTIRQRITRYGWEPAAAVSIPTSHGTRHRHRKSLCS